MKIEIHNDKAVGIFYYDIYDKNNGDDPYFNILLREYKLTAYEYVDIENNKCFLKLYGSITNMLRFRNILKYWFDIKEKDF